jgi:hypothetical protein
VAAAEHTLCCRVGRRCCSSSLLLLLPQQCCPAAGGDLLLPQQCNHHNSSSAQLHSCAVADVIQLEGQLKRPPGGQSVSASKNCSCLCQAAALLQSTIDITSCHCHGRRGALTAAAAEQFSRPHNPSESVLGETVSGWQWVEWYIRMLAALLYLLLLLLLLLLPYLLLLLLLLLLLRLSAC